MSIPIATIKQGGTRFILRPYKPARKEYNLHRLSEDALLAYRVDQVKGQLSKIKQHRPVIRGGVSRQYPVDGDVMSTRDYVIAYARLNHHRYTMYDDDIAEYLARFEPLSNHVSVPEGIDSCEPWDGIE